ncbi:MAG TPA: carboxypeptidase regulatory-like domain-containing protein, partial [Acidobacteriaceae bacterium]|nr:carboxypeptidase regulatory-like domain-containing protein [Acidobacteriaceae bacterium]
MAGRRVMLFVLVVAVMAAIAGPFRTLALGQAEATGTFAATIVDPTGAVIPGAEVTLTNQSVKGAQAVTATSDGAGLLQVSNLPPGEYTVEVRAKGFSPVTRQHVTIRAGHVERLTLKLPIEVQEQKVEVNGNELDSSPDSNGSAIVLKGSDLDALPDDPQELQEQLQAIAGANPDAGTQFYVDGFSGGRIPPKSEIKEIRINQNPYSAQYDEMGWGRVEIITKAGTGQWHGNMFLQGNDSSFNSRNPFVKTQPPYHSLSFQGGLSGPVTKHTSQFTDVWHQNSADDSIVNAFVLDDGLNQVPFTATYPNTSSMTDWSTRFDMDVGERQSLSLRYSLMQFLRSNAGVGQFELASQAYDSHSTEQTIQFSDTQTYGAKLLNETRFQYIRQRDRQTPQNLGPTIVVQGGFTGGGSNQGVNDDNQDHYELQDYVQTSRKKHTIDFGARLRMSRDSNFSMGNFNGQYTFASLTAYQIMQQGVQQGWTPDEIRSAGGGPSLFSQTTGEPSIAVSVFDMGLYAEDNYKIKPNITLSYGLRWEWQTRIPDHGDFAPRLGASWALSGGKNKPPMAVIRAGAGLFYQRFESINVLTAERENGEREHTLVVNQPDFYPAICSTDPAACSNATTRAPTTFQVGPSVRAPYLGIASIGVDKPLGRIAQISINYQFTRGDHLYLTRNINAPLPGTYDPTDPTSGVRPLGTQQNIYQYESEGESTANRLIVNANVHAGRLGLYGYYMLGKAEADTGGIGSFPSNSYDLSQDYGRSPTDIRNRLFMGGYWNVWHDFRVNPFLLYSSSRPFNIVVGQDLNGDTQFNDRPTFATDLTRASVVRTEWGVFDTDPIAGQKVIPVNYGKGPDSLQLNLGVAKAFNFGPELSQPSVLASTKKPAKKPPVQRKYSMFLEVTASNVL